MTESECIEHSRLCEKDLQTTRKIRAVETYREIKIRHRDELHELIRQAIKNASGIKSQAARDIGMDRGAMLRIIREHGVDLMTESNLTPDQKSILERADKFGHILMEDDHLCPGIHFCPDWDGLAVCEDSPEAYGCHCGRLKNREKANT